MKTLLAYAKINLTLEVLRRRPDGYHDIASVMQTIDLSDTLSFAVAPDLQFYCDQPTLVTADNLVVKAMELLQAETSFPKGAMVRLTKNIPVAAGLGGGSSDAAATLQGLNELWGLHFPMSRLLALAQKLGSDVPFFLYGGTALAQGRGEKLTPLPPLPQTWVVLAVPPFVIEGKTKRLYQSLREGHFSQGVATQRLVRHLDREGCLESALLYNSFEKVVYELYPWLEDYRQRFLDAGAPRVHLTGSGPTLFALVPGELEGQALRQRLEAQGLRSYLVPTCAAAS